MDSHDLSENTQQAIVMEAGRDLARINAVAIDGCVAGLRQSN